MNLYWFQLNLHNAPYTSQRRLSLTWLTSSMEPTVQYSSVRTGMLQRIFANKKSAIWGSRTLLSCKTVCLFSVTIARIKNISLGLYSVY